MVHGIHPWFTRILTSLRTRVRRMDLRSSISWLKLLVLKIVAFDAWTPRLIIEGVLTCCLEPRARCFDL
jgi:hypothetical protein